MNHSLLTADSLTHLKILAVSLIAAIIMMLVGISARVSTPQTDARTKASSVAIEVRNLEVTRRRLRLAARFIHQRGAEP